MKKLIIILMIFVGSATGQFCFAQWVHIDKKTAIQAAENSTHANLQEDLYKSNTDSTRKKRETLALRTTLRMVVRQADMASKQNLGDFGRQSQGFKSICFEASKLCLELGKLLSEAQNHPKNLIMCVADVGKVVIEAKGTVDKAIYLAYNGKVPNPFKGISLNAEDLKKGKVNSDGAAAENDADGKKKSDGVNLLRADERIRIIDNTISDLRSLRRATTVIRYKLMGSYTFRDVIRESVPYHYYWAKGAELSFNRTMDGIKKLTK